MAYRRSCQGLTACPITFSEKFNCFAEQWSPKVVAEMNDYQFKLVRLEGDFVWHDHQDTDETFIVLEGTLVIDFQDGTVELEAGFWQFRPWLRPFQRILQAFLRPDWQK